MNSKRAAGSSNRSVVKDIGYRQGSPKHKVNKAAVVDLGTMRGSHTTDGGDRPFVKEPLLKGPALQSELGNAKAVSCGQGPGGGRSVYKSGSQGQRGKANPGSSPARVDILSQFGPEKSRG